MATTVCSSPHLPAGTRRRPWGAGVPPVRTAQRTPRRRHGVCNRQRRTLPRVRRLDWDPHRDRIEARVANPIGAGSADLRRTGFAPRRPGSLLHGDHRRPTALSARSDGADPERPFSCALVRRASGFAVVTRSGPTSPSTAPRTAPSRRTTTATCHPATRAPRTSPPRRRSAHPPRATTTPTA